MLGRIPADDLVEHAAFVVDQRKLALLELLEELVSGDLDEALMSDCCAFGNIRRTIPTSPP
jgi:hypothetical protein